MNKNLNIIKIVIFTIFLSLTTIPIFAQEGTWEKTFDFVNKLRSIQQTTDGGYVAITTKEREEGKRDFYLLKMDENGNKLWDKIYQHENEYDLCKAVRQTSDEGYILAGGSGECVRLVKTDKDGNLEWNKLIGGDISYDGWDIDLTSDGGYVIGGRASLSGQQNKGIVVVKTDSLGNKEWSKIYGDEENLLFFYSIKQTRDGGYIIGGYKELYNNNKFLILKIDSSGNEEWEKIYGGDFSYFYVNSVIQTEDNGYIAFGDIDDTAGYSYVLFKMDVLGNIEWYKSYEVAIACMISTYRPFSFKPTPDGGYIIAGTKGNYNGFNGYLLKTDSRGDKVWDKTFYKSDWEYFLSIDNTTDGGYIISGTFADNGQGYAWVVKTDENGCVGIDNDELSVKDYELEQNYPNPFNPTTTINFNLANKKFRSAKIGIYNNKGEQIWAENINKNTNSIQFDGSKFNSGIYYYSLIIDGKRLNTKSMVLIK